MLSLLEEAELIDSRLSQEFSKHRDTVSKIKEAIREQREAETQALAHGDVSENAELAIARDSLRTLNARYNILLAKINSAKVATVHSTEISIGSVFRIFDVTYKQELVMKMFPEDCSYAKLGVLSIASPVGSALRGQSVGADVFLHAPSGEVHIKVLEVY